MTKYISIIFLLSLLVGCRSVDIASPRKPQVGYRNFTIGKPLSVTVGEQAIMLINGPYREYYQANGDLIFNGLPLVPMGSLWDSRLKKDKGKGIFLTRKDFFNERIAILINENGQLINNAKGAWQIHGVKWRTWPYIGKLKQCFKKSGIYSLAGNGFKIYYLGRKGNNLKFYIAKFTNRGTLNFTNERLGNLEYIHDMNAGKIFTIRGITIRIDKVDPDGKLHYTVVKENKL